MSGPDINPLAAKLMGGSRQGIGCVTNFCVKPKKPAMRRTPSDCVRPLMANAHCGR